MAVRKQSVSKSALVRTWIHPHLAAKITVLANESEQSISEFVGKILEREIAKRESDGHADVLASSSLELSIMNLLIGCEVLKATSGDKAQKIIESAKKEAQEHVNETLRKSLR